MAKRGYKQGAMSATDAITQLRAAAAKCDHKWMKAHAASARFFGAREADVKHALKRCGTTKSSLMGAKPRKRKRGIGMFDQVAASMEPGDERDYTITIERGYKGHPGYTGDMRGLKGTAKQHADRASRHLRAAREELEWMTEGPKNLVGSLKTRKALETKIRRHLEQGVSECSWTKGEARAACEAEIRSIDTALSRRKRSRKR